MSSTATAPHPSASFQPRADRINLSLPCRFTSQGSVTAGSCLNLSESGMLVRLVRPAELWTSGEIDLDAGIEQITALVRVARVMDHEAGLIFAFRNNAERTRVSNVVLFARGTAILAPGPPF